MDSQVFMVLTVQHVDRYDPTWGRLSSTGIGYGRGARDDTVRGWAFAAHLSRLPPATKAVLLPAATDDEGIPPTRSGRPRP